MSEALHSRIALLASLSSVLLAVALLLPLVIGGNAVLVALGILGAAAILAVYVAFLTLGAFGGLPVRLRVAGLLPAIFVSAVVALVLGRVAG